MGQSTQRKRAGDKLFKGDSYKFFQASAARVLKRKQRERFYTDPVVCEVTARKLGAAR
jgi:hypothetical protein